MAPTEGAWAVERVSGGAGILHSRGVPAVPFARTVELLEAESPALVLGSAQRPDVADAAACALAGIEVARRGSGGGAVLVDDALLWLDVLLPAGDPLWENDVSSSARWLGLAWCRALREVGAVGDPVVHEGSMCLSRWGRLVCFAGLGPGEVTDGEGGPKVVGISQRRTRHGARFQCAVPFAWQPARLVTLLRFDTADDRTQAATDLAADGVVRPLDPSLRDQLVGAFLTALP